MKEGFIGADTCKGCHEAQYATYKTTVHSKKHVKGPASQDACETCHGSGAKHVGKAAAAVWTYSPSIRILILRQELQNVWRAMK